MNQALGKDLQGDTRAYCFNKDALPIIRGKESSNPLLSYEYHVDKCEHLQYVSWRS